jgi:tRNA 2-thiouridine synthesizing protein A
MDQTIAMSLDLKGLSCPMPIAKTAQAVRDLATGDLIEVFATDPGSVPDFAAWCENTGHELVERSEDGGVYRYLIRKR